jgi:hypothetical protein
MKRWLPLLGLMLMSACALQPTPQPTPFNAPPTVLLATVVPIPTLLPTVTLPPVNLPATPTTAPTPLRSTSVARITNRFPAPVAVAPKPPTLFKNGNDIKFIYDSVGKLEPNQCYLVHVELAVPDLARGNRGDDFVDTDDCGDQGPAGKDLNFVLYRGKFTNSPNYGTILAQTLALSPEAQRLMMTWFVRVVQNNGRAPDQVHFQTVPLSPNSPVIQFEFQP